MRDSWIKDNWKNYELSQQPEWQDKKKLNEVLLTLKKLPSLVFSGETRKLSEALAGVNEEKNFVLQVGNCAESFSDCNGPKIHNFLRILLQMAMVLEFLTNKKIIKIGRIAGQYAKPRSLQHETINGKKIPSYRGDIINEHEPTLEARTPKPEKLIEGYFRSAATLNLIRAFIQGGYNEITNLNDWSEHHFSKEVRELGYYKKFAKNINDSLADKSEKFLENKKSSQIYTSHEGLILDYEESFTRLDTVHGGYYDTSAHFIWVGDRTRQSNSSHIEFVSGIGNPVGVKVGPGYDLDDLIKVIKKINHGNKKGRLTLICRMGHEEIKQKLNRLIRAVKKLNLEVIWVIDPMHGNTFKHNGFKVRAFDQIVDEIQSFFRICLEEHVIPGGIHLEITDENVTECIGGLNGLVLSDLSINYSTKVDPRLNAAQALEIAFIVSELLNNHTV